MLLQMDILDFAMMNSNVNLKILALCRTTEGQDCMLWASLDG